MTSTKPTTTRADDSYTARRAFDRDQRDLRDLFERHSCSVYAAALAATGDPQAAGELTRQVFAELWHDRDRLAGRPRSVASMRAWLCAAARDRARDRAQNR
jgi:DNA-directed RNA polymerase specialized sigma24 family protein